MYGAQASGHGRKGLCGQLWILTVLLFIHSDFKCIQLILLLIVWSVELRGLTRLRGVARAARGRRAAGGMCLLFVPPGEALNFYVCILVIAFLVDGVSF